MLSASLAAPLGVHSVLCMWLDRFVFSISQTFVAAHFHCKLWLMTNIHMVPLKTVTNCGERVKRVRCRRWNDETRGVGGGKGV